MKSLKNLIIPITGGILLSLIIGCGNKGSEIIENPVNTVEADIAYMDTYWKYASRIKNSYPCLKEANLSEIENYIRFGLNNGKRLFDGEKVKLPVYDCE